MYCQYIDSVYENILGVLSGMTRRWTFLVLLLLSTFAFKKKNITLILIEEMEI